MNTGLKGFYTLKVEWSLNVPHSGHWMYHQVEHSAVLRSAHTAVFMCFVWISEQTAIISLHNINWLVCITETECVYCAVRTGSLNIIQVNTVSTLYCSLNA